MFLRGVRNLDDVPIGFEHCGGQATRAIRDPEAVELRALVGGSDGGAEVVGHRAGAQGARDVTRVVPACAIGDQVQAEVVAHEHGVFVVRAALTDIRRAARLQHELGRHE
jgi:hypothetical protein